MQPCMRWGQKGSMTKLLCFIKTWLAVWLDWPSLPFAASRPTYFDADADSDANCDADYSLKRPPFVWHSLRAPIASVPQRGRMRCTGEL